MTKAELIKMIEKYPDDVEIYVDSGDGMCPQDAEYIMSTDEVLNGYHGIDTDWSGREELENIEDVTAISITA